MAEEGDVMAPYGALITTPPEPISESRPREHLVRRGPHRKGEPERPQQAPIELRPTGAAIIGPEDPASIGSGPRRRWARRRRKQSVHIAVGQAGVDLVPERVAQCG